MIKPFELEIPSENTTLLRVLKRLIALICFLTLSVLNSASAQPDFRNTIYLEAGGNAGMMSVNYELAPLADLRLRAGAGLLLWWPTVPLTASWLLDKGKSRLEVGTGVMILLPPGEDTDDRSGAEDFLEDILLLEGTGPQFLGTAIVAYRYTATSGFNFRVGFTSLIRDGVILSGGISFGMSF